MDHISIVMTTLSNSAILPLDTVGRKLSYFSATVFILIYTYEITSQYFEANRLSTIEKEKLTPLDKALKKIYFDDLCNDEIASSWYVRNYNFLFTLKLLMVVFFIITMQYLQSVQVILTFIVIVFSLVVMIVNSRRHRIFEKLRVKVFRIIQEGSFVAMVGLLVLFYIDQKTNFLKVPARATITIFFSLTIVLNVLLEIIILVNKL